MSTVDFAIEADDVHNPSVATGKPMPDSEVIKLRLKRSLLEEIRELTKGAAFTMQEVLRAAIQLGLPHLKTNPKLVTKSEAGLLPKSLGHEAMQNPNAPPPDPRGDHGPTMEELIQGKDEWWHIREIERRLKKIEDGFTVVQLHDAKGNPFNQEIPNLHFELVKEIAEARGVSFEEAYRLFTLASLQAAGVPNIHQDDKLDFSPVPERVAKRRKDFVPGSKIIDVHRIPAKAVEGGSTTARKHSKASPASPAPKPPKPKA